MTRHLQMHPPRWFVLAVLRFTHRAALSRRGCLSNLPAAEQAQAHALLARLDSGEALSQADADRLAAFTAAGEHALVPLHLEVHACKQWSATLNSVVCSSHDAARACASPSLFCALCVATRAQGGSRSARPFEPPPRCGAGPGARPARSVQPRRGADASRGVEPRGVPRGGEARPRSSTPSSAGARKRASVVCNFFQV